MQGANLCDGRNSETYLAAEKAADQFTVGSLLLMLIKLLSQTSIIILSWAA
jgi:hypothetical protein